MPFDTDRYLDRTYRRDYRCLDFVAEVWLALRGECVREAVQGLIDVRVSMKNSARALRPFREIPEPKNPCLVSMQRSGCTPHIGVFIEGSVLHLCYPHAELSLIYTLGCYNQTFFNYYKKKDIIDSTHSLSKNYLEEYKIK